MNNAPLSPMEQREMYRMVEQTNRLLIGEQAANGQVLQVGLMQRMHRMEKWKADLTLRIAFITGGAVSLWYGAGEFVKYLHEKLMK